MAAIARPADAGMDATTAMFAPQITGLVLGENVAQNDPLYIKASDGKVYKASGAAVAEAANFIGAAPRAGLAGQPITIFGIGARFRIAAAGTMTPGAKVFLGGVAGGYDTAAQTGDATGIGRAVTDTDMVITRVVM
jgi:hypothetical protein